MKVILLFSALFLHSVFTFCQDVKAPAKVPNQSLSVLREHNSSINGVQQGTYQVIQKLNKPVTEITGEVIELIGKSRKDNEEVILAIGLFTRVRILPRNEIMKPDFKPVPEIIYEVN